MHKIKVFFMKILFIGDSEIYDEIYDDIVSGIGFGTIVKNGSISDLEDDNDIVIVDGAGNEGLVSSFCENACGVVNGSILLMRDSSEFSKAFDSVINRYVEGWKDVLVSSIKSLYRK